MSKRIRAELGLTPAHAGLSTRTHLSVMRGGFAIAAAAFPVFVGGCSSSRDSSMPSVGMRQSQLAPKIAYGTRAVSGPDVPRGGGGYKLGSPYRIGNVWYVPHEDPNYDRTGTGSWYGADFHGRKTANGEIYNMNALTAAHPTLPIPSYVTVTNLANNRTILVRVNDRGPYVGGRVIDLSKAAAQALGYETMGTANVRVRYAGRAPLNGDDSRERSYLNSQPWRQNAIAATGQPPPVWHPTMPTRQAYAAPAHEQPRPAPAPDGWTPDSYRRGLTQPKAAPVKDGASSWSRGWGLGGQ